MRTLIKILLLVILMRENLFAQDNCTLVGRITDVETKSGIQYANIIIRNTPSGATSEKNGFYSIENIPEGNYDIKVSLIGYRGMVKNITLNPDSINRLNFELEFGDYTANDARRDIENGIVKLYLFGWPIYSPKVTELAEKYEFEIGITGCYPLNAEPYNEVMYKYLEQKFGKGWREKFEMELMEIEED